MTTTQVTRSAAVPRRRISIRDVARAAEVSTGTVSRVLNNHPDVSPHARERVQAAIARLGFRPSPVGRALSKRTIDAIGILIPDMADPVFALMAEGIESVASQAGYAIMLGNSQRASAKELQFGDLMAQFGVSGVVIIGGSRQHDRELANRLGPTPAVVVARRSAGNRFPAVTIDHYAAARLAVDHLLDLGHRRIGAVRGDPTSEAGSERQRGYVEALAQRGIAASDVLTAGSSFELAAGIAATEALLALAEPPSAIFFATDELALGGMRVIKDHGLAIPGDISVVSINDIPFAATSDPPLTTVHMPARELGMLAMQTLLELIQGRQPLPHLVLGVELVVRGSTGPCAPVSGRPGLRAVPRKAP